PRPDAAFVRRKVKNLHLRGTDLGASMGNPVAGAAAALAATTPMFPVRLDSLGIFPAAGILFLAP
ncbi:MAG: hypothetical protein MI924_25330, partial [Chloroflexales bacterium]|nr:hypothetical protein [Chloroflexales bacterium]